MTRAQRNPAGRPLRVAALFACVYAVTVAQPWPLVAQSATPAATSASPIRVEDLREWLGYLASDELQGRQVFTEGYGLAAQYVAGHLQSWGVTPLGSNGSYLQPVRLRGYAVEWKSSVTVTAGGQRTTFEHGDHVTFPTNAGGRQTLTFTSVEFVGYGQPADLEGRDLTGKLIVTVPNMAPPPARGGGPGGRGSGPEDGNAEGGNADDDGGGPDAPAGARGAGDSADGRGAGAAPAAGARGAAGGGRGGRGGNAAVIEAGAPAAVSLQPPPPETSEAQQALAEAQQALQQATAALTRAQQAARGRGGRGRGEPRQADFSTVQNLDNPVQPQFTGDDTFFEALFAGSPVSFADVKAIAQKGEPLQAVSLPAEVTVTIDNTYEVVSQRLTNNVVGLVEGSDPVLRNTYILLGAHLDHAGYSQTATARLGAPDACRRRSPAAQEAVTAAGRTVQRPTDGGRGGRGRQGGDGDDDEPAVPFDERDAILNGADDDGSGSTALMAIARAFATGPRPKRSVVFVWHAGEESGLFGSRYNADFPVVPIDAVQAHLNLDMVGRNDCDNIEVDHANTLFVVGADRISTGLHNTIVETNAALGAPLTLDYELNDADDPENVYRRSDHYSYAAKGIPVAFFTTGLHPDYHRVTDTVDKIEFEKMARIADLIYRTGMALANREAPLERDNQGPRTGFGSDARPLPID
jgi:hypothetical protein